MGTRLLAGLLGSLAARGGVAAQLQRRSDLVEAAQPDDGVKEAPLTCTAE
jgi:hypothetical protein